MKKKTDKKKNVNDKMSNKRMYTGKEIFQRLFDAHPELWALALNSDELPEINITIGKKWRMNYQHDIREQKRLYREWAAK